MAVLQLARIQEALAKARQVGRLTDSFSILGCDLVIQTLNPEDHEGVFEDTKGLDDVEYYNAYQLGGISRSIIEINGVDLRDTDFIEAEVPEDHRVVSVVVSADMAQQVVKALEESGLQPLVSSVENEEPQTVRLERHVWLKEYVLKNWGREALNVAWRKLAELMVESEQKAKEGVQFRIPDESPEDKYRRLLGELQEIEDEMPDELVASVLESQGYLKGTSAQEKEAIKERARKFAEEQSHNQAAAVPEEPQEEVSLPSVEQSASEEKPASDPSLPAQRMQKRQPLNRVAVAPKVPQESVPRMARQPVDPEIKRTAINMRSSRSEQIAQLEGQLGLVPTEVNSEDLPVAPVAPEEVAEIRPLEKIDPKAITKLVDAPPKAGINPRYRPHNR